MEKDVENSLEKLQLAAGSCYKSQENGIKSGSVNLVASQGILGISHSVSIWQTVICC